MAEGKQRSLAGVVQKQSRRAREKLLQNFGKADKTIDEMFDRYVDNFIKQQNIALKLQKELRNYIICVKAMQVASKSLMETISEVYEDKWINSDQIPVKCQILETLWEDYCQKINEAVAAPLNSYLNQFPDMKTKIAKRKRKLVDYDGCRHNLGSLQQNTKRKDDLKIAKAKEELDTAKQLYEVLNNELHEELPALYESRIPFFVSNLQTLFSAEVDFHSGNFKMYTQLSDLMDQLAIENQKGVYAVRKHESPLSQHSVQNESGDNSFEDKDHRNNESSGVINGETSIHIEEMNSSYKEEKIKTSHIVTEQSKTELSSYEKSKINTNDQTRNNCNEPSKTEQLFQKQKKIEELFDIPVDATTTDLPSGVLYRVRTTYKYTAEDADELSFDAGEIIAVIEYNDPEEQEEGWLMGYKEASGEKGLFPANFTKPI
ncbi:LOW QUALITY PROTEIN: myc box-dependent-interacting protein 1-like [Centruroides vittatus]|uniref:LOW QUALITY PROTEIN: myc box-dependent-interacting protein 1-like n=1 Tax=Centruroides vittatus TaxID=120091 RepID=UPI00350F90A5